VAAYVACDNPKFLSAAVTNLDFLLGSGRRPDGGLYRSYKAGQSGRFTINGFLEDYAYTAEALVALYQATFEEKWLHTAKELVDYAITHFHDPVSGLFYFTSDLDKPLVARKMEIMDNVTPSSNSSMAKTLFALGACFGETAYADMAFRMLNQVRHEMPGYGSGFSNWAMLALHFAAPFHEVVLSGPEAEARRKELARYYLPNKLLAGSASPSKLSILHDRFAPTHTALYVCRNRVCALPVDTVPEALRQIQKA
jgi:uncharacterized protein YyaL (SSP411 family)